MGDTKIEWTDKTWNPVTGCSKTSKGCLHCYAERMSKRLAGRFGYPPAPHNFDVTLHSDRLDEPLHWHKPKRIFVVSMGDLFHKDVPLAYILSVFYTMAKTPQHVYQVLTKRPRRMLEFFEFWREYNDDCIAQRWVYYSFPLDNVWIGFSAENQQRFDERWNVMRELTTQVPVIFVSLEPLLSHIALPDSFLHAAQVSGTKFQAIIGGESGPGARPMHPDWARSLRDQCQASGIPFHFKQFGDYITVDQAIDMELHTSYERSHREKSYTYIEGCSMPFVRVGKKAAGRLLDGQLWDEYPE